MLIHAGEFATSPIARCMTQLTTYQFGFQLPFSLQKNAIIINSSHTWSEDFINFCNSGINFKDGHIIIISLADPMPWFVDSLNKYIGNYKYNVVSLPIFSNYLFWGSVSHHMYRERYFNKSFPLDIKHIFLNYNRIPRWHRNELIRVLSDRNLSRHGVITLGITSDNSDQKIISIPNNFNDSEASKAYVGGISRFRRSHANFQSHKDVYSLGNPKIWNNTFVNIVSETLSGELFITEKTFKPIVGKRPFIINGSPFTLQTLREHGFKTFSNFWDESYDTIVDPITRIHAIADIIGDLSRNSLTQLSNMYNSMTKILEYNHIHMFTNFIRANNIAFNNLGNAYMKHYNI